ncbi:MAG: glutamine amidotransferase [Erysipelotrichaceae bacterium]|nr:glutamine amidotransferase [Erysipelotrichaceae bacterium]
MELKILWMYHDLMDLYGDKGNTQVLKIRAEKRGIDVTVDTCTIGEKKDISAYDLFFMGGGADNEQGLIYQDLLSRKDNIAKAMEEKTAFLLICGGYQLFGKYYKDQDGNVIDGLGFFDYYTEASDRDHRCIGNIALETEMDGETFKAVGFENHGGQTKNVSSPFGRVLSGHGNTFKGGFEGFMNEQVAATYMHGPLLPKNPKIADKIILRALKKRYGHVGLEPLDDTLENSARDVMLKRLGVL